MKAAVDSEVPVGTLGTIIRADQEDSDLNTYEVQWDNGVHSDGMREYNMEIAPETNQIAPQSYLERFEARQIRKSIPEIFASARRLRMYLRQAANKQSPQEIMAEFKSKVVPFLDNYTYQKLDTGDQIIIPDSSEMWNQIHTELDTYHDLLKPFMDQPDVEAVVREIEEYHTQVQPESTPKHDLAKLKDVPDAALLPNGRPMHSPDEPVEHSELGATVENVIDSLPSEETGMDELLDRWTQSQSPEQKAQIEQRIRNLHDKMLHAYLLSTKRI
jgi:hypothetical protein